MILLPGLRPTPLLLRLPLLPLLQVGATSVKAIQATITLPTGVELRADATGKPLYGVIAATGSAASGMTNGKYTPATATAPATLTLGLMTTVSLAAGDIITIKADLASGSAAPAANAFTLGASKLVDTNGNIVSGASLDIR